LIVDLHLRTGSGLEIVRHCRAHGITPYCVMLSGDETPDALEAARLAGVDAVLVKPARLASLREVLRAGVRARAA
jgi:DNA-binding response OmpR family regulator